MDKSRIILFPLIRDFGTIPPTVSIINYLAAKGYNVVLFSYFTEVSFEKNVRVIKASAVPYPKSIWRRAYATVRFHFAFYHYLARNKNRIFAVWLGAWDVVGISKLRGRIKLVYQFHELEEKNFDKCRKADYVVIPEENRAWITSIQARLERFPLILPNIPYYEDLSIGRDSAIVELQGLGKLVVLYSGLVDIPKRDLKQLVLAFKYLPAKFVLVIMPSFITVGSDIDELKSFISSNQLSHRARFIEPKVPPMHFDAIASADIGVGFYSATSLNNLYAAPNRLYEYLNCGTPIVLPNFPSFKALSKEYPFAINVADSSRPEIIASVIESVLKSPDGMRESMVRFQKRDGNYDHFARLVEKTVFD